MKLILIIKLLILTSLFISCNMDSAQKNFDNNYDELFELVRKLKDLDDIFVDLRDPDTIINNNEIANILRNTNTLYLRKRSDNLTVIGYKQNINITIAYYFFDDDIEYRRVRSILSACRKSKFYRGIVICEL